MLLFADALERVEQTGERWFESELHRLKGAAMLVGSDPSFADVEAEYQQALAIARKQEARFWELRAATSLASLWYRQKNNEDAKNLLAPVCNWFTEGLDTPYLKKARALQSCLQSVH